MSEGTVYRKLQSLEAKGCISIVASERSGRRIRLKLPCEMSGLVSEPTAAACVSIEEIDFFEVSENRSLILARETYRCFYCLRVLNDDNYVIEHVVSRPEGGNGYRNVVASCRACNNRKSNLDAAAFLRKLYRETFLTESELAERVVQLQRLKGGDLKPQIE